MTITQRYNDHYQRSCLSQLHLDNALRIGLETREPSDFPFVISYQELVIAFCATNVMFLILVK